MAKTRWEYDITIHTREQIESARERLNEGAPKEPVVLCDAQGVCMFDRQPDANVLTLTSILNERGSQGWQLVQIDYRSDRLICTWRCPLADERGTHHPDNGRVGL